VHRHSIDTISPYNRFFIASKQPNKYRTNKVRKRLVTNIAIPAEIKKHNANMSCNIENIVYGKAVNNNKNTAGIFQLSNENMKCEVTAVMITNSGSAFVSQ
jgi:hypothetical protein